MCSKQLCFLWVLKCSPRATLYVGCNFSTTDSNMLAIAFLQVSPAAVLWVQHQQCGSLHWAAEHHVSSDSCRQTAWSGRRQGRLHHHVQGHFDISQENPEVKPTIMGFIDDYLTCWGTVTPYVCVVHKNLNCCWTRPILTILAHTEIISIMLGTFNIITIIIILYCCI